MNEDLGACILECVKVAPGGVLIFFSSYLVMSSFYKCWEKFGYVYLIKKHKPIFMEPKE